MFPRKSNCKVHRVEPLKESEKLRMGCAASQAAQAAGSGEKPAGDGLAPLDPIQYPPAEAFEIPLANDSEPEPNESLIKKHPPKRLQRLTENSVIATTIEDLEEKLAKAEIRRQKYLQERSGKTESIDKDNDWENKNGDQDVDADGNVNEGDNKDIVNGVNGDEKSNGNA